MTKTNYTLSEYNKELFADIDKLKIEANESKFIKSGASKGPTTNYAMRDLNNGYTERFSKFVKK